MGAQNHRAGGKIGCRHIDHQFIDGNVWVVDKRATGIHHLAQIVGWDIGGHAHGDAACAVDQQMRDARGHHHGFALGLVVIGLEVDGVLVDILQQRFARRRHAHFGIPHGSSAIAVDGSEVSLAVQQRQAQGKILGHAHQGVIDRLITVRMVFADDVADHPGGFSVLLVTGVATLAHGVQNASMNGFQPVAHVW